MTVKIADLMSNTVLTCQPHHSVDHVRGMLERNRISAIPVVDTDGEAVGIVTANDLVGDLAGGRPVNKVMSAPVHTVPRYNNVEVAARKMLEHRIHHLVVTHERVVVGIISTFDLVRLVAERRFVAHTLGSQRQAG